MTLDATTIEHIRSSLNLRLRDLYKALDTAPDEDHVDALNQSIEQLELTLAKFDEAYP